MTRAAALLCHLRVRRTFVSVGPEGSALRVLTRAGLLVVDAARRDHVLSIPAGIAQRAAAPIGVP